jgi:Zn-finger nucleic acid-binding protein
LNVEGLAVDACRGGCGGIWFDNFELSRVDEAHERLGEALAALDFDPNAIILREKRPCPKCAGITMLQHKFSREKLVTVDECPNCGGVWLDGGELAEIRHPVTTAAERKQASQAFFSRLATAELAQLRSQRPRP